MITVYYDGKCGICSKEINHYRKVAPEDTFVWKDIIESQEELKKEGISLSYALKYLHAKDKDAHFHIGVDAFILIWKQLKRWRLLASIVSLPIIYQLVSLAYSMFARFRFNRLDHCKNAEKKERR